MSDGRDDDKAGRLCEQPAGKPYPSWDEMMARIRRERTDEVPSTRDGAQRPEWHDLVADMIVGR